MTVEITYGIGETTSRVELKKVMSAFGEVEVCHMGSRGTDKPFVRFRTGAATEAALVALKGGKVFLEDGVTMLAGERKQGRSQGSGASTRRRDQTEDMSSRNLIQGKKRQKSRSKSSSRSSRSKSRSRSRRRRRGKEKEKDKDKDKEKDKDRDRHKDKDSRSRSRDRRKHKRSRSTSRSRRRKDEKKKKDTKKRKDDKSDKKAVKDKEDPDQQKANGTSAAAAAFSVIASGGSPSSAMVVDEDDPLAVGTSPGALTPSATGWKPKPIAQVSEGSFTNPIFGRGKA